MTLLWCSGSLTPCFCRINLSTVSDTAHPCLQFCQEGVLTVSSRHLGWLGLLIKKISTPCPASPYRVLMCCSEAKLSNGPQCLFWLMLINWFKTSYFKDTDSLKVMLLSQGLLLLCFSNFINSPASLLSYFPIPAWRNLLLLLLLQAFSRENYWKEWGAVLSVVLTATTVPAFFPEKKSPQEPVQEQPAALQNLPGVYLFKLKTVT